MRKTKDLGTPEERRLAAHALGALDTEINLLCSDGMPPRLVCVTLLMSACRLAMHSNAVSPHELDRLFHLALASYTEDGA